MAFTSVACMPLGPSTSRTSTAWPVINPLSPAWRSVTIWTNTSASVPSGQTNPKPLFGLNHLTVALTNSPPSPGAKSGACSISPAAANAASSVAVDVSTDSIARHCMPFAPLTAVHSIVDPGGSCSYPACRNTVMCRNTSDEPSSGDRKPYPRTKLNHFTVPRIFVDSTDCGITTASVNAQLSPTTGSHQPVIAFKINKSYNFFPNHQTHQSK